MQDKEEDQPEVEITTISPDKHIHTFYIEGDDVRCKTCYSGWPGLARYINPKDLEKTS